MKLALALTGDAVTCTAGDGTLSHRFAVRYERERVLALTRTVAGVLERATHVRGLSAANLDDLRHAGDELCRSLLAPEIQDALRRQQGPLLLELDEALVLVPWELLHDGERFLCRRFDVGRAVSTAQPPRGVAARGVGTPMRVLVLASDPAGDLPQAGAEAEALVAELDRHPGVRAHLLASPDLAAVRRLLKDFDAVHYAGHADADGAGGPSGEGGGGWRLADGRLTPGGVVELAGGLPLPLIVFANACRSGPTRPWEGEPGGLYGQCNAFLLAGVRYYVGTQWDVVDAGSAAFAVAFWGEIGAGASVGAAVRRARERVALARGEDDLGWAPYVLYGDPAFAPLGRRAEPDTRTLLPSPRALAGRKSMPFKRPLAPTDAAAGAAASAAAPARGGRRRALLALGLALALGAGGVAAHRALGPAGAPAGARPQTLALLGIRAGPSIEEGAAAEAAGLESCLLVGLSRGRRVRLVDRARITAFLAEARDGGLALASDDRQASAAGRALRADYVLYGEATVVARRPFFSVFCADPATGHVLFADRLDGRDAAGCDALAARILARLDEAGRARR
ncbi:MAG TPA: CHAT domain-containing protein [Polyangia bacterium]